MARPKLPPTITITVTIPRRKRASFMCRSWDQNTRKHQHHMLYDGDHLTSCPEQYCTAKLCQNHWPDHEGAHTLQKLGGE
jgi:hypothetical protein